MDIMKNTKLNALVLCFTISNVLICNIFPLTATPQNSVAQCPPDSLNTQNTVTLKRTGVCAESHLVSAEPHLNLIHNHLIITGLVTFPAGSLFMPRL